jgi:hypothetical protein
MLQQNIDRFKTTAPMSLPQFINNSQLDEVAMYDDYALLFYSWKVPMLMARILDVMDVKTDMVLLYHYMRSKETDFGHELCYYSYPDGGQMFKINMVGEEKLMVKEVVVTVYDSLEQMCFNLLNDLHLHDLHGTYEERRREADLIADFS